MEPLPLWLHRIRRLPGTPLMHDPLSWISDELSVLDERGLARTRRSVTPLADAWCELSGKRLRNFATNDYLNLAHDPRLIKADRSVAASAGCGARASALVAGRTGWHTRLETKLAQFEHQEAAILFPTGYAANSGTISAIVSRGDVVFSDRLNHASLIDGCRLSRAETRVYPHGDLAALQRELKAASQARRRLIVTDAVFSMDADLAPLVELCDLAERHESMLLIDEAHATGVFGEKGRGVAELKGIEERGAIRVGTLSKAVGAMGGFVAGPQKLIDWLWNRARTQMFSTALPPAVCAAAAEGIEIIQREPWRRERLLTLSDRLRSQLQDRGVESVPQSVGPIVPVVLNSARAAIATAECLERAGFLVGAIRPPTVPEGTSRLRITLTCGHREEDVDELAGALAAALRKAG